MDVVSELVSRWRVSQFTAGADVQIVMISVYCECLRSKIALMT